MPEKLPANPFAPEQKELSARERVEAFLDELEKEALETDDPNFAIEHMLALSEVSLDDAIRFGDRIGFSEDDWHKLLDDQAWLVKNPEVAAEYLRGCDSFDHGLSRSDINLTAYIRPANEKLYLKPKQGEIDQRVREAYKGIAEARIAQLKPKQKERKELTAEQLAEEHLHNILEISDGCYDQLAVLADFEKVLKEHEAKSSWIDYRWREVEGILKNVQKPVTAEKMNTLIEMLSTAWRIPQEEFARAAEKHRRFLIEPVYRLEQKMILERLAKSVEERTGKKPVWDEERKKFVLQAEHREKREHIELKRYEVPQWIKDHHLYKDGDIEVGMIPRPDGPFWYFIYQFDDAEYELFYELDGELFQSSAFEFTDQGFVAHNPKTGVLHAVSDRCLEDYYRVKESDSGNWGILDPEGIIYTPRGIIECPAGVKTILDAKKIDEADIVLHVKDEHFLVSILKDGKSVHTVHLPTPKRNQAYKINWTLSDHLIVSDQSNALYSIDIMSGDIWDLWDDEKEFIGGLYSEKEGILIGKEQKIPITDWMKNNGLEKEIAWIKDISDLGSEGIQLLLQGAKGKRLLSIKEGKLLDDSGWHGTCYQLYDVKKKNYRWAIYSNAEFSSTNELRLQTKPPIIVRVPMDVGWGLAPGGEGCPLQFAFDKVVAGYQLESSSEQDEDDEDMLHEASALSLMDLVKDPDLDSIRSEVARPVPTFSHEILVEGLKSQKERGEKFLQYNAAESSKHDARRLAEELLWRAYPQQMEEERQKTLSAQAGKLFGAMAEKFGFEKRIAASFQLHKELQVQGGSREVLADQRKVCELREPFTGFLMQNAYAQYNRETKKWSMAELPIRRASGEGPTMTLSIPEVTPGEVELLIPLGGDVVTERVHGIDAEGKEHRLNIRRLPNGAVTARATEQTKGIVYSFTLPDDQVPADVEVQEFQKRMARFMKHEGAAAKASRESIGVLSLECQNFLSSKEFQEKTPFQKIVAIEAWVRANGHYDAERTEQIDSRLSLEQQWKRLSDRARSLKSNKLFAGMCTDFSLITCAMLRQAGFAAGIMTGYSVNGGKEVKARQAHQVAYALWPSETDDLRPIVVDGTPPSSALSARDLDMPALEARFTAQHTQHERSLHGADELVARAAEVLRSGDAKAIRELDNGALEQAMRWILANEIRASNTAALKELMDGYWYTPVSKLDFSKKKDLTSAHEQLTEILQHHRRMHEPSPRPDPRSGQRLLEEIRDFAERLVRARRVKDASSAYNLMHKLLTLTEKELEPQEERAMEAVLAYLQTEKMVRHT
jgi:hypothetical protein